MTPTPIESSMDMALDDIISKTSRGGRGRGGPRRGGASRGGGGGARRGFRNSGGGGGGGRFNPSPRQNFGGRRGGDSSGQWAHDRYEDEGDGVGRLRSFNRPAVRGGSGGGFESGTSKLLISNLDFQVSENDIEELFSEFGPLRRAAVHYDRSGRSLGSADVVFERRSDAQRAVRQYDNVPLDGRPMKIQLVGPGTSAAQAAARSPGQGAPRSRIGGGFGGGRGRGSSAGSSGGRGRGGGGGRGRGGRSREPAPSQDDLDKELDAYVGKSA